jgi:hypothetical protein
VVERQTLLSPTNLNAGLAAMITEAFAIQKQLLSGSDASPPRAKVSAILIQTMSGRHQVRPIRRTQCLRPSHGSR